jgi:Family of unknown function (DUF5686)/CarboxypepD_reg-like domain
MPACCAAQQTAVTGRVTDAETGQPIRLVNVAFAGTHTGTATDGLGKFSLTANGRFSRLIISGIGYQPLVRIITPGTSNEVQVRLAKSNTQLKEVDVSAGRNKRYRNRDNPAVELIRHVIAHKDSNRAQSSDYLQYGQYERVNLSLFDVPPVLVNNLLFRRYRFILDTVGGKLSALVYLSEKQFKIYNRRKPEKSIRVLEAQKESNIIKFIDTAGVNIYLNRLYGNTIDIYDNNIFIITNQLLSPIANHAPDFYKFFITDTIRSGKESFVELSFIPRNKGDLLFEGHLLVSLDGRYAVTSCELNINNQININFLSSLTVSLDFQKQTDGRYFLIKSDVKADFGILKNKGFGVAGERSVYYSDYVAGAELDAGFYRGKSEQIATGFNRPDSAYWLQQRPDTLPKKEALFYRHVSRLEKMQSFKTATWVASTVTGGYADLGPFQFGLNNLISFDYVEGLRLGLGGRTTPKFNKTIYLEGFVAEGTMDHQLKYNASVYYAFNQTPFYRFPNNYLKVSQQYDISLPGQNLATGNFRTPISSFQTGTSHYYFYSSVSKIDYVKEFENHFSFDMGFKNRDQQATGELVFTLNDAWHTPVNRITVSELDLILRYAPHEQLYQGTNDRSIIHNQYPIITLQASKGLKRVFNGSFNYSSITATVVKRFYLSQLGFADVTLLGNLIIGKVPFPLLNISPANQSIVYEPNFYNKMNYLEFVSDHYAGVNLSQSFNGFFLNKVLLIQHLKWREYLSFKVLYGGLRAENNPSLTGGLYNFPVPAAGTTGTYALGNAPYLEAGAGIGNIFKFLRVDVIRRFNYLDHPDVSPYGLKFTLNVDL